MGSPGLEVARAKMVDAGIDPTAIEVFVHYYRLLEHGETGMVPEESIEPIGMPALADVEVADDVLIDLGLGDAERADDDFGRALRLFEQTLDLAAQLLRSALPDVQHHEQIGRRARRGAQNLADFGA